ncbi:hypothetical protein [Comamonas odontotermitis]|uniref:hypothetical protein n=1 Tax=Comamonas odontotermitis TaxID=379895 RepID=UPI001CC3C9CC|nr:hypothetical protein [Comamonas odontotermitis]UBB15748.1 hypothetical protein LAD35_12855 [Comamonas odontotermitis]
MKNLSLVVACSTIALSACSKSPVDIVKSSYIDGARTTTVANGLNKRPLCKSTHWDSFKDDRGRVVVQYKCSIADGNDFLKERRDDYLERTTKDAEIALRRAVRERDSIVRRIEEDYPDSRGNIERLQRGIERFRAMPKQGLTEKEQIDGRLFQIQEIERVLGERRRDAQRELESSEQGIVSAQKRNDSETLKKEAFARHPVYKEASEIFQWIVNGEGQAALIYGEIQAVDANGREQTLMKYNRPEAMLNVAAQAQESKILDYMRGIGLALFTGALGR